VGLLVFNPRWHGAKYVNVAGSYSTPAPLLANISKAITCHIHRS
jgi:hypothetical protein